MTILVTGGLGQVGRFLLRSLMQDKIDFIALDKRENNEFKDIKIINSEITERESLKKFETELKKVTTLVHLASLITNDKDLIKSGHSSIDLNLKGTINLLEFLPNLKNIIFSSTYMVYGTPKTNPISEEHQTNPNVIYGASKIATEKFLQIFAKEKGIPLTILRLMGIYNVEKPHGQAIPNFIEMIFNDKSPKINGNGKIRRNHLYIDDAIDAIMKSIKNPVEGVFNIGGYDSPSNLEIIKIINSYLGKSIKPEFVDNSFKGYDFITDISKAEKGLGFIPKIGIKEGIEKTIKRYSTSGW